MKKLSVVLGLTFLIVGVLFVSLWKIFGRPFILPATAASRPAETETAPTSYALVPEFFQRVPIATKDVQDLDTVLRMRGAISNAPGLNGANADWQGIDDYQRAGRLIIVDVNTHAALLETQGAACRIRVLDGAFRDREGWVAKTWLRPTR